MIHRYEDAAFVQDTLLHNINSLGYFSRLCDGFQNARFPDMPKGLVRNVVGQTMLRADPIYVSDDVMTLWEHAAESFSLETLLRTDLVVPAGFAVLPRPFSMKDMKGKEVKYRVLAWLPVSQRDTYDWDQGAEGQGVWITLLSNINDIDDYWTDQHEVNSMNGETIRELALAAGQEWSLMHGSPIMFDTDPTKGYVIDEDGRVTEGEDREKANQIYGHIQCFWRLMSQLVMTPEPLPRQARRQRQRARRIDTVKILKLRRYRHRMDHEGEGPGVEYSHRFIVSGHWRNQPYGSKKDRYYRQIWISPYVKGPEDKPLVVKDRGVEFTR